MERLAWDLVGLARVGVGQAAGAGVGVDHALSFGLEYCRGPSGVPDDKTSDDGDEDGK